jgi:hypothetical protein
VRELLGNVSIHTLLFAMSSHDVCRNAASVFRHIITQCKGNIMRNMHFRWHSLLWLSAVALIATENAHAALVNVTVTVRNLAPANSVSFTALRLGFGNGTFDAFNVGQTATAPIISVAERGAGFDWFPAFAAAEPNAVLGSVGTNLFPGSSPQSATFVVDSMSANNRFFTFANMVIPSNDLFLGNDNPMGFQLFDASGNLLINSITQTARDIWDAGSESPIVANAAFIPGSTTANRESENGVVRFSRAELSIFNGLQTNAGYTFSDAQLTDATGVYEIGFSVTAVPEPSSAMLISFGFAAVALQRRRKSNFARA